MSSRRIPVSLSVVIESGKERGRGGKESVFMKSGMSTSVLSFDCVYLCKGTRAESNERLCERNRLSAMIARVCGSGETAMTVRVNERVRERVKERAFIAILQRVIDDASDSLSSPDFSPGYGVSCPSS